MTTPNQEGEPDPPGAITGYGSWSEVQGRSQDDWKNDINAQWDNKFLPVQNGTNFLIVIMLKLLASLLSMVPFVGNSLAEVVNNIADGINNTHNTATTANNTAVAANDNASAAIDAANNANSNVTAAQEAASNAANVALAAQETADIAYANAQNDRDGFGVSTAGVNLGFNEDDLGILMTTPPNRVRKITRVIYAMKSNTGTISIDLVRRALNGTETVVLSTNVPSTAITYADNSIDFETTDLDQYYCTVTSKTGLQTSLRCWIESVLLEAV